jgi:hypothetical protein
MTTQGHVIDWRNEKAINFKEIVVRDSLFQERIIDEVFIR